MIGRVPRHVQLGSSSSGRIAVVRFLAPIGSPSTTPTRKRCSARDRRCRRRSRRCATDPRTRRRARSSSCRARFSSPRGHRVGDRLIRLERAGDEPPRAVVGASVRGAAHRRARSARGAHEQRLLGVGARVAVVARHRRSIARPAAGEALEWTLIPAHTDADTGPDGCRQRRSTASRPVRGEPRARARPARAAPAGLDQCRRRRCRPARRALPGRARARTRACPCAARGARGGREAARPHRLTHSATGLGRSVAGVPVLADLAQEVGLVRREVVRRRFRLADVVEVVHRPRGVRGGTDRREARVRDRRRREPRSQARVVRRVRAERLLRQRLGPGMSSP